MSDTYKEVKTFCFPGAVVRVHRPALTEAEAEKRMQSIRKQTEIFMKENKNGL